MAGLRPVTVAIALAMIIATTRETFADDKCRTGCQGVTPNTFKYEVGSTYKYSYEGTIEVTLSTAEGQQTGTKVKANVLLSQLSDCNQLLKLENVQIFGSDGKAVSGKIENIEKPVRLNFHDGHLEDIICAEPGDTQNSLNVKRAIASMFQANTKHNHETDVFGVCPTEISTRKDGQVVHVHKSRHLNKCAYRENIQQDFLATAFDLNSEIKSSPLLNGDYTSQQQIKNGILEEAEVREDYIYVPFSVGKNGAKAHVHTKLRHTGTTKSAPTSKVTEPKSIIFENPHIVTSPEANVNALLEAVKAVAHTIGEVVGPTTSRQFVNLVKIIREAKTDDLLGIYNQVSSGAGFSDKDIAKKVFLDALFRAGTGEAVEVAIKLLQSNKLTDIEKAQVYLGLSFVKHGTKESLSEAAKLLDQPDLPRLAYLGVGNLAGRYCREHPCKNVDDFHKLTEKMLSKLGDGKATNRKKENEIVYVLKSLANVHYLSDNVLTKLVNIAKDDKAPTRVRVTALETFLADPCKDKLRTIALNILKDIQQDSEIRIKAYLALAQCPNGKVATAIKDLLENEPSYQVGGFIVSHIKNIRASANPDKELAKQQLGMIGLPKRFPFDFRKYSFNGEFSYAVDTLGVASSAEANVIYSQKSFLPRSTSLNLTTELFGHSFNFLEVATRQENLDRLLEHFFGPRGVYRDEYHKVFKRDLRAEIEAIGKTAQIKTNSLNADLDLDLSVKLFGSEFLFFNLNDDARSYTPEVILDKVADQAKKTTDEIKHLRKTIRSNALFLDAELSYPTSLGFPLRLAVEGSSAIQVFLNTNLDINSPSRHSDVKVTLVPSANIEIVGRMTLDAHLIENGLRVSSTLYTATGGDLKVEVFENGGGFDVKFGLPVQEQKIVSASHEIVFNTRLSGKPEQYQPLKFSQNNEFAICVDQLSSVLGITVCGEVNGPNLSGDHVPVLPFPFSGNSKYDLAIKREDIKLYHIRANNYLASKDKYGFEFAAEAIGTRDDKKFAINFEGYLQPERYFKLSLVSPIKKASAEARLIRTDNEKALLVRLNHDQNEYYGKAGVSVSGNSGRSVYKPILEYRIPGDKGAKQPPYHVTGEIIYENDKAKITFNDVKLVMPNKKAITIKGNAGEEKSTSYVDITVTDGKLSGTVKGRYQYAPAFTKLNVEFQNTANPEANFNLKLERKHQDGEYTYSGQLIHGQDLSSKKNIISFDSKSKYVYKTASDFDIGTDNKFTYPLYDVKAEFEFEATPKSFSYDVEVHHREVKVGSELSLKHSQKFAGDYDFEFELYGLENRLEVEAKREIVTEGLKSKVHNSVEINGKKYDVSGTVNHQFKPQNINVGAELKIKVPGQSNPVEIKHGFISTSNEIDTHLKITSGSNVFIDSFLKAARGGSANGSIKVNIKDHVTANGQLKASKGSGSGEIVIEFVKRNRKIKGETTFTIHPIAMTKNPVYTVVVTVYPDFARDTKKKVTFSTDSKFTENSVDTQNYVEYHGQKVALNGKGAIQGQYNNGKTTAEVELILPNDHYTVAKLNRDLSVVDYIANGEAVVSLEHRSNRNTPGCKLTLKGTIKDTDIKRWEAAHLDYGLVFDDNQGRTLNGDLHLKRAKEGAAVNSRAKFEATGSVLPEPVRVDVAYGQGTGTGTYKVGAVYGKDTAAEVSGEFRVDPMVSYTGTVAADVKTPLAVLKVLKFKADGEVGLPKAPQDFVTGKGAVSLFVDDDGTNKDATVDFATEGQFSAKKGEGSAKGTIRFQKQSPVSLDVQYGHTDTKGVSKCHGTANLQYGADKAVKAEAVYTTPDKNDHTIDLKLTTPSEKAKNIDLKLHTKRSADGSAVSNDVVVTADGKTYTVDNEIVLSEMSPSFDVEVKFPDGKVDQLRAKLHRVSDKVFDAELKAVSHQSGFSFDGAVNANLENVDDFSVKVRVDSPNLKLDKIVLTANNKGGAKGGKRIHVSAKSGEKNLLSGSTSYKAHVEGNKYIVEGSGTLKIKEESKSANFKYIRQDLTTEKNGERGIEVSFDAGFGNKALDSELKITNKQFRLSNSYCEEKKQCAHVEVDSKISANDIGQYNHELEISIDLRKLGLTHEFGLKSVTNRKQLQFDHTVDVHFQNQANSKYQYSVYVHPKKAGASLTTPKRIMAVEGVYSLEGEFKGEIAAYLDKKNHPDKKTALTAHAGLEKSTNKFKANAEFKTPAIGRALTASYVASPYQDAEKGFGVDIILDVFPRPDQKITITGKSTVTHDADKQLHGSKTVLEIKSSGLKVDVKLGEALTIDRAQQTFKYKSGLRFHVRDQKYDSGVSVSATPKQVDVQGRLFNRDLFKVYTTELTLGRDLVKIGTIAEVYGSKTYTSHLEVKNLNTLKYTLAPKDSKDHLDVNAGFIVGQIADFRADVYVSGAKKELVHASVKLDDANFLKSDYGINADNIKTYVLERSKEHVTKQLKEVRELVPVLYKELSGQARAVVDSGDAEHLRSLRTYYVSESQKIKDEFLEDKTISDLGNFIKGIVGAATQTVSEIFASFSEFVENVAKTLQANFAKVRDSIDRELLPKFREATEKVVNAATEVLEKLSEVFFAYVARVTQFLDEHQEDFKEIVASVNVIGQDVARFLLRAYENARELIVDQVQRLVDEIRAFPLFEELKLQFQHFRKEGFAGSAALINSFKDAAATLKDAAPTPELKQLVAVSADYVEKKLRGQDVDDFAELQKIAQTVVAIVTKTIQGVISTDLSAPDVHHVPVFNFDYIYKLPKLVAVKFSPVAYLLAEGLQAPYDLLYSFSLNPRLYFIPLPHYALLVQGKHVFTFDGKHLTFPGKCDYLLARDAFEGNFSVVGTFTDGILTAISVADKQGVITLKKNGIVTFNNEASELPIIKPEIEAYRLPGSVTIRSKSGVEVTCGLQLVGCGVHISGFYHGRLRGLLGNGNYEPYDDFTAADGKITASESAFGNSYKLGGKSKCAAVKAVEHHHAQHESEACAKLFGYDSTLRYCYRFVNPENFKTACEHGVAAGDKETEFAVAVGYVAACNYRGIPVRVPEQFVKCENSEKPFPIGEKFSVKLPGKAADIVLLVDLAKTNEATYTQVVQPLVQHITQDLNAKGINDVEYHLITYGGAHQTKYPRYNTVDGKIAFKGKAPALKFSEPPAHVYKIDCSRYSQNKKLQEYFASYTATVNGACDFFNRAHEELAKWVHDVNLVTGFNVQARTYDEGLKFPYRSHATKTVIAVTGNECEVGRFLPLQIVRSLFYVNRQINLNLITPLNKLTLKDAQHTKEVIGFNKNGVFVASQAKKKPEGNAELLKQLDFDDYCSHFTVSNGGNVFVANNYAHAKDKYVQVVAHNIVDQLVNREQGLDCECGYTNPYAGTNVCQIVYSKENESSRKG